MSEITVPDMIWLAALATAISGLVLWLVGLMPDRAARSGPPATHSDETVFLFRQGRLTDHDAAALSLPPPMTEDESDWSRFCRWTGFRFGPLPQDPTRLDDDASLQRDDDAARLTVTRRADTLRVILRDPPAPDAAARHAARFHEAGLQHREAALRDLPLPVWILGPDGQPRWRNACAAGIPPALADQLIPPPDTWPEPGRTACRRHQSGGSDGLAERWHDVHVTPGPDGAVLCAEEVTRLVRAEQLQRDFVQTLGKTFATLATGLVIFDRAKTLALFNPALADLTGLPPAFLSARPNLFAFFDALRDRMVMPEPRNYASWRSQIAEIVKSAAGGHYQEIWNLPGGQTYRVTGRPHPDGAVAFLFEDISTEISATRRDRSQIELRQSALDRLDEGIAVLARDGQLLFCNTAFAGILGIDPETSFACIGLHDVISACQARFPAPELWSGIEHRIARGLSEQVVHDHAATAQGDWFGLRLAPIGGGRSMLSLDPRRSDRPATVLAGSCH